MADKISFDLVSPEKLLLSEDAEMVTLPGSEGEFGVLAGHAALISTLKPGVIAVKGGAQGDQRYFVTTGFADVSATKLTVLAEEAIPMESVNTELLDQRIADGEEDILQAKTEEARAKAVAHVDALQQLRAAL